MTLQNRLSRWAYLGLILILGLAKTAVPIHAASDQNKLQQQLAAPDYVPNINRFWIIAGIIVIILQALLIVGLYIRLRRYRQQKRTHQYSSSNAQSQVELAGMARNIEGNHQAEAALQQQNEYLIHLQETTLELISQLDLDHLLENIVVRAAQLMGTSSGFLDFVEADNNKLIPKIAIGNLIESLSYQVKPGEGVSGIVWETGEPLIVNDYDNWTGRVSVISPNNIHSLIGIPLKSGEQVIGVLGLAYDATTKQTFAPNDIDILLQFAHLATLAIENARLFTELQKSEARFRAFMDHIPFMAYIKNTELKHIYGNKKLFEVIGVDEQTFIGTTIADIVEAHNVPLLGKGEQQVLQTGEALRVNDFYAVFQNVGYWLWEVKFPIEEEQDKRLLGGLTIDITQRKQTEEALRQANEQHQTIINQMPNGYILWDQELRIQEWNPAAERIFGYTKTEMLGKLAVPILVPPEIRQDVDTAIDAIYEGQDYFYGIQNDNIRKDGTRIKCQWHNLPIKNNQGKVTNILSMVEDVTERIQTEAALRESEEKFRQLTENIHEVFWLRDFPSQKVLYVSPAYEQIWGRSVQEVYNNPRSFENITHPDDIDRLNASIKRQNTSGQYVSEEYRIIRPDGTVRWIHTQIYPVTNENGELYRLAGVAEDITERKQADIALAQERDMLARLMQTSPVGITIVNQDGQITYANPRAEDIFGLSKETITQRTYNEPTWRITAIDGGSFPEEQLPFIRVTTTLQPVYNIRHALEWPGGKRILVSVNASPIFNELGEFEGMIAAIEDITAQEQAALALRESQEQYQTLFNSMLDAFALHEIIYDDTGTPVDYTFLDINPAFRKMTGLTQDIIGKRVLEVMPGIEPYWIETYGNVVLTGEPIRFENTSDEIDGKWFKVIAFRTQKDRFATIFQDITENKRAAETMRINEERTIALFDLSQQRNLGQQAFIHTALGEIIKLTDSEVGFLYLLADDEHEAAFYMRPNISDPAQNNSTNDSSMQFNPSIMWEDVIKSGQPVICNEFQPASNHPNYPPNHMAISRYISMPIFENEKLVAIIGIGNKPAPYTTTDIQQINLFANSVWEIFQRQQAEQALRQHRSQLENLVKERTKNLLAANEQLAALTRVKDEFVSNVSHELRTPITNLVLRHHLIKRAPHKLAQHLDVLERETQRLQLIVEDLLRLSRLDQDRVSFQLKPTNLNKLVGEFIEDRTLMAEENGLALCFMAHENLSTVSADSGLLEQVLSILLTNAINYPPKGGAVEVRTTIQMHKDKPYAGLCVHDNGLGIQPDDQKHLFERFFRGEAGRQTQTPGTGLGLAIAQEIIKRHQGWITVESDPITAPGTTFWVWLPLNQDD